MPSLIKSNNQSSSSTWKHLILFHFFCVPSCQAVIKRPTASFPLLLNWVPWAAAPPQDGRRAAEFFFPPPPPGGLVPADGFRKPAAELRSAEGKKNPSPSCFCTPAPLPWDLYLNFISFYICLLIFRSARRGCHKIPMIEKSSSYKALQCLTLFITLYVLYPSYFTSSFSPTITCSRCCQTNKRQYKKTLLYGIVDIKR